MKLEKFERYPLTFGKTAIEHLPRLSEALGGKVQIYAKREDCNSGMALGGNKLRKLEYIVPDILASGADTLVSIGGAVQPYPHGRSDSRQARHEMRRRAGEMGPALRRRL